jgi:hypothetical protein
MCESEGQEREKEEVINFDETLQCEESLQCEVPKRRVRRLDAL